MNLRYRSTCRVCGNPNLTPVIDLGDQYLQGSFVKEGVTKPSCRKIPTKLVRCDVSKSEDACGLVQMSVTTPPKILYSNYWYQSGISATMRNHLKGIANEVMKLVPAPFSTPVDNQNPDLGLYTWVPRVMDIACNDGTLLSNYPIIFECYGVDPSDIARTAAIKAPGATIINDLFPPHKELTQSRSGWIPSGESNVEPLPFDAITSIAMFYDLEDPVDFACAIKRHLKRDGIWVLEVAYLPTTLSQVSYDTIVGEHLEYYALSSLERILEKAGLRAFRAELNDVNGGSIRLYSCRTDCFKYDNDEWTAGLNAIRLSEFDLALDTEAPYEQFRAKVAVQRKELHDLIAGMAAKGEVVHLLGASTKANTLLQACGLDSRLIPYASERSPEKHGAKTLGTDIKIVSEEESRAMKPAAYLVGPWHFKAEIMERERDTVNRDGIKLIFPLPTIEVVSHVP